MGKRRTGGCGAATGVVCMARLTARASDFYYCASERLCVRLPSLARSESKCDESDHPLTDATRARSLCAVSSHFTHLADRAAPPLQSGRGCFLSEPERAPPPLSRACLLCDRRPPVCEGCVAEGCCTHARNAFWLQLCAAVLRNARVCVFGCLGRTPTQHEPSSSRARGRLAGCAAAKGRESSSCYRSSLSSDRDRGGHTSAPEGAACKAKTPPLVARHSQQRRTGVEAARQSGWAVAKRTRPEGAGKAGEGVMCTC